MNFATVLESAAITVVFVQGSIFDWAREVGPKPWRELARCPLCAGFWVGALNELAHQLQGVAWRLPEGRAAVFATFLGALGAGAVTGALALLYRRVADWLESSATEADEEAKWFKSRQISVSKPLIEDPLPQGPPAPPYQPRAPKVSVSDVPLVESIRPRFSPSEAPTDPDGYEKMTQPIPAAELVARAEAEIKKRGGD